jgi:HEAT repeat protein
MKSSSLSQHVGGLLVLTGLILLPDAIGHGGTYIGPGDTVPPGSGEGGDPPPASPPPSAPGQTPGRPSTPSPGSPGSPPGGTGAGTPSLPRSPAGSAAASLDAWQFWWAFNKHPYLDLRSKVNGLGTQTGGDDWYLGQGTRAQGRDSLAPTRAKIEEVVIPALLRALESERSNDILTGAMIALAKIGDSVDESKRGMLVDAILPFLKDGNLEVSETAALSLGILQDAQSAPLLVSLMMDEPLGRQATGKTEVPFRMRAFAAYGLGLIGNACGDNATRQEIAKDLIELLESPKFAARDIKVAAMTALGLTPVDAVEGPLESTDDPRTKSADIGRHVLSRQAQIEYLVGYLDAGGKNVHAKNHHWFVRAHAPTAIARLCDGASEAAQDTAADALIHALRRHTKLQREIQQGSILALGQLGDADGDAPGTKAPRSRDARIRATLLRVMKAGQQQEKRFALMSLAHCSSRPGTGVTPLEGLRIARRELQLKMAKGHTAERPWAALALGVLGFELSANQGRMDSGVSMALRAACEGERNPVHVGAYAIALGLRKDVESSEFLLGKLRKGFKGSPLARGEIAVGLGLMDDRSAIAPISDIIKGAKYKPDLLKQAAIALGLLGDKALVPELIDMLDEAKGLATQAALSSALGAIGDSRSIEPLVQMLEKTASTDTARGFAAVALGIVCDKQPLPWGSKIAVDINYLAATPTLSGGGMGILEIL